MVGNGLLGGFFPVGKEQLPQNEQGQTFDDQDDQDAPAQW